MAKSHMAPPISFALGNGGKAAASNPDGKWLVPWVEVGDRWIPEHIAALIPLAPGIAARLAVSVVGDVPRCSEIRFESDEGAEVLPTHLVQVSDALHEIVSNLVVMFAMTATQKSPGVVGLKWAADNDSAEWVTLAQDISRARTRRRTMNDHLLQRVADIYRENVARNPTSAVRDSFLVSDRTAARYVQLARERGFLPRTTRGKKRA